MIRLVPIYLLLSFSFLPTQCSYADGAVRRSASVVFSDDFENGPGNWSTDNGVWEVGTPSVVGPPACFDGTFCAGTVLAGNYPLATDSRLISPSIILPAVTGEENLYLRFREWHEYAVSNDGDNGQVQISEYDPGTQTWSSWENIGVSVQNSSPVWSLKGVDVTAHGGKKVRIGFYHINNDVHGCCDGDEVAAGWYIDDVQVVRQLSQFDGTFETGWGNWFADNGVWEIGQPTVVGPSACHSGGGCAGTVLGGNYGPQADSRLIFPDVQLPSVTGVDEIHLRFWDWHQYPSSNDGDHGQVQVSVYDPAMNEWSDWHDEGAAVRDSSALWTQKDIDLTLYSGKRVRIAFYHIDSDVHGCCDGNEVGPGWYIDDVTFASSAPLNRRAVIESIQVVDLNGNGAPEEATLVQDSATGRLTVWLRDGATGAVIKKLNFGSGSKTALGLAETPDIDHNGQPEIAVLFRNGSGENFVMIRDAGTRALISRLDFGADLAESVIAMADTDGNGVAEVAIRALNPTTKQFQLELRDALSGAEVRTISLP